MHAETYFEALLHGQLERDLGSGFVAVNEGLKTGRFRQSWACAIVFVVPNRVTARNIWWSFAPFFYHLDYVTVLWNFV